ncbi:MAG: UDP-3-O-(3-hydroxymyristoyl)glucosamine N-acyltransferase [Planctomycetes bacterium]|nr:UDP-3-O-(3-hydroxymyristoyl)glucosamine N-acyltransferase [Planctomycetota bacterium]
MTESITLAGIASMVGGSVRGDEDAVVSGVATIKAAGNDELTWASAPLHRAMLADSSAGAVLINDGFGDTPMPAIVCADVDAALVDVLGAFSPKTPGPPIGIHETAIVAESATIGKNVAIGRQVIIDAGAVIGDNCVLHDGVVIGEGTTLGESCRLWFYVVVREGCSLGDRVTIHTHTVVGADGFGYVSRSGTHRKIPHLGGVVIGNDVEIGASTCIDRSKTDNTIIGDGTKIDNQVQVAHNVQIGKNCIVCAQVGIAGSTRLGDYVVVGGQAGLKDNIEIGSGVMLAACACVPSSIKPNTKAAGSPAVDYRQFLRENASIRRLPDLINRVHELTKRLNKLECAADDKPDS